MPIYVCIKKSCHLESRRLGLDPVFSQNGKELEDSGEVCKCHEFALRRQASSKNIS